MYVSLFFFIRTNTHLFGRNCMMNSWGREKEIFTFTLCTIHKWKCFDDNKKSFPHARNVLTQFLSMILFAILFDAFTWIKFITCICTIYEHNENKKWWTAAKEQQSIGIIHFPVTTNYLRKIINNTGLSFILNSHSIVFPSDRIYTSAPRSNLTMFIIENDTL